MASWGVRLTWFDCNLKVLFAARDPFAAEKATETWQKYELLFYSMARNCFKNILQHLT